MILCVKLDTAVFLYDCLEGRGGGGGSRMQPVVRLYGQLHCLVHYVICNKLSSYHADTIENPHRNVTGLGG